MTVESIKLYCQNLAQEAQKELVKESVTEPMWGIYMEEGRRVRSIYLGTVMSLAPSGKYYTLWASNLSLCPECKGEGCKYCGGVGSREGWEDAIFFDSLKQELEKLGLELEVGKSDPCDLFVVKTEEILNEEAV